MHPPGGELFPEGRTFDHQWIRMVTPCCRRLEGVKDLIVGALSELPGLVRPPAVRNARTGQTTGVSPSCSQAHKCSTDLSHGRRRWCGCHLVCRCGRRGRRPGRARARRGRPAFLARVGLRCSAAVTTDGAHSHVHAIGLGRRRDGYRGSRRPRPRASLVKCTHRCGPGHGRGACHGCGPGHGRGCRSRRRRRGGPGSSQSSRRGRCPGTRRCR